MRLRAMAGLFALLAVGLTACERPPEDTRPGQPVKTRQQAFKAMLRSFEPMGAMLRTHEYHAERFLAYAEQFHAQRAAPWPYFGPGTDYPPSKARPEVWSRAEAFAREREAFLAAADQLLAAARTRNEAEARRAYFAVYDLCESCHREFKRK